MLENLGEVINKTTKILDSGVFIGKITSLLDADFTKAARKQTSGVSIIKKGFTICQRSSHSNRHIGLTLALINLAKP